MSTLTTINGGDGISPSRTVINANFAALNNEKIETSVLDVDTALTANSDLKVATQKAVKAYVDAGGNVNASETTRGIVEEATDAEVTAGTATGGTGAKLFVTPTKLATRIDALKRSRKITASGASVNVADSTATETNVFSTSISASLLGTSNAIRIKLYVSNYTTTDSASDTLTIRLKYGATTITSFVLANNATINSNLTGIIEGILFANASASAQTGNLNFFLTVNDVAANTTLAGKTVAGLVTGTATENSATALNLIVSAQWASATSANDFFVTGYTVELIE